MKTAQVDKAIETLNVIVGHLDEHGEYSEINPIILKTLISNFNKTINFLENLKSDEHKKLLKSIE